MPPDVPRIGVFSLHSSKETKAIRNAVEDLGGRPEWLRRENTPSAWTSLGNEPLRSAAENRLAMDDVVKTLLIVLVLSLTVTLLGGVALFGAIDQGSTPNTALLVASLVVLVVDLWYARKLFAAPQRIGGSE